MTPPEGDPRIDARAIAHFQAGDQALALVIEYRWFGIAQYTPPPPCALPDLEGMMPVLVLEDWPNAMPRDDGVYKSSQARDGGVLQTRYMIYAERGTEVKRGELSMRHVYEYMCHFRDVTQADPA